LNHLIYNKDLSVGYEPYGDIRYAEAHGNSLCYTLALPLLSLPVYILFDSFGNSFRLFATLLWTGGILLALLLIGFYFPRYARIYGVPWTYGAFFSLMMITILNMWLYQPFLFTRGTVIHDISTYPEVAAIVFTNHIAFAIFCVFAFLIGREIFRSGLWGLYSLVGIIAGSSYLFWSGNAKDHMLTVMFLAIVIYLFLLFLRQENGWQRYCSLAGSFIAVGWLAWVRPELGLAVCGGVLLAALVISAKDGWRSITASAASSSAVLIGALPLFINNYGLMGHPLIPPMAALEQVKGDSFSALTAQQFQTNGMTIVQDLYRIFINPENASAAGIFQVSPLSAFAFLLVPALIYLFYRKMPLNCDKQDAKIIIFLLIITGAIFAAYLRSFPGLGISRGIIPDIRYLCPAYLPMVLLGMYTLKITGFDSRNIKDSLKTLAGLVIVNLPLVFIIQQYLWGSSLADQLLFNMVMGYLFLALACITYLLVLAQKVDRRYLAYAISIPLLFSLVWELVVDFRFATYAWEGYHFWIPVVQYIWYIFYHFFPL